MSTIDVWIKMYIYTIEYFSAIKMNDIFPSATLTYLEGIMLSAISQKEKDGYHVISLIHGI